MGEGESVWGEWGTNRWADYREIYIVCSDCQKVQTLHKEELFAMMQLIYLQTMYVIYLWMRHHTVIQQRYRGLLCAPSTVFSCAG